MASSAEAAAHIDLSRVAFAELIAKGIITKPLNRGGYDLAGVRLSYIRHMRKIASGRAGGSGAEQLTAQRVRVAAARAEREERLNAIERGEVCELGLVEQYLKNSFLIMRARMLNLPGELAYAV